MSDNELLGLILSPELVEKVLPKVGAGVNIPAAGDERIKFYREMTYSVIVGFIKSQARERNLERIVPWDIIDILTDKIKRIISQIWYY